MKDIVGIWK